MNTYYLRRYINVQQDVVVEAVDEQEAIDKADNEDWIDEEKEEQDWDCWEVIDVEVGREEYIAKVTMIIEASNEEVARMASAQVHGLRGNTEHMNEDEAEITDTIVDSIVKA